MEGLSTRGSCPLAPPLSAIPALKTVTLSSPRPVAEIQLFEWRGKGHQFSELGEMLLFHVCAGRPDVNRVLKFANRIGISDFTTI